MIEFSLPMRAFSINKMNYRDVRFKTSEFKLWFTELCERLQAFKELLDTGDDFKREGGVFEISITVKYPHHIFYTKNGTISAKTFDISNVEKPIIDAIFRETMRVDDRYLVSCHSEKVVAATYGIDIKLERYPDNQP